MTKGGKGGKSKGGKQGSALPATVYDASTGIVTFTDLGSQVDFQYDGTTNSLHTSCSAPFGIGVRTFTSSESKDCQGGATCGVAPCTGCFEVIDAISEGGASYCDIVCKK